VRVSSAIERCGVPTASIVISGFIAQGKLVAKSQGLKDIGIAEYPGTMMTDTMEQLVDKVNTVVTDNIIRSLTVEPASQQAEETATAEPKPRDIVFKGDLGQINDYFYEQLWTDGLPIIPPTIDEAEKFLSFTDRSPDEVIGVLPHENREATVWNIAVNGVMAGCRPEYMPVLIAVVEAIADKGDPNDIVRNGGFRAQDAGTTPGWEPLIVINGPIIKDLDFNYGQGVMRIGRRANSSIGRFLRMFLRNVGGFRLPPGNGDKGSIAQNFNVVLAENEDAVKELGWQPYSVDRGFAAGDNTVTVLSSIAGSAPIYSAGSTAIEHLDTLAEMVGRRTWALFAIFAVTTTRFEPLLMMSPSVARILSKDGWTKDKIKEYFFEKVRTTAGAIQKQAMDFHGIYLNICEEVKKGKVPPEYCECDDPERSVKVFPRPESIQIVVSGDPNRNQSKGFIQNGYIGAPTTKKVELPEDWKQRLNKA